MNVITFILTLKCEHTDRCYISQGELLAKTNVYTVTKYKIIKLQHI